MLINTLHQIINVLDDLIQITLEDIENIKQAKHEEVFKNIATKEKLAYKFYELKNEIDNILVKRNKPIEEIFSPEEEKLFDKFREKLNIFYKEHKRFSKLAFTVANFYNTLNAQIKNQTQISYSETANFDSNLKIKA